MPAPPGESSSGGIVVVNTEVDYTEDEDMILVDPDEEQAQEDVPVHERTSKNQERLDLLTHRLVLQTKLERSEKINEVLAKQNSHLLSLLPQTLETKSSPSPLPTANETKDLLDKDQLFSELTKVKRENEALRYTFLGEAPLPPSLKVEPDDETSETKPVLPTFALPAKPEAGVSSSTSLSLVQPAKADPVDLKAVLNRVQALFQENEELAGLLVGEMRSTDNGSSGIDGWMEVINESKEMITALDDDLEIQAKEIARLLDRVKGLEHELETALEKKEESRSRSRGRSNTRSRSPSRSPSRSRSRSRARSDRSESRDEDRRSDSRSRSRSRSRGGKAVKAGRRSRSRSRSRTRSRSPVRSRTTANQRQRSSSRSRPYREESRPYSNQRAASRRSRSPPTGPRKTNVPPPRSSTSGSNWRDAHGIPTDDLDSNSTSRPSGGKSGAQAGVASSSKSGNTALPGLSIFGSSSRSAPKELLPSSPGRETGSRNSRADERGGGARAGGGGGGGGGRSRSPARRDQARSRGDGAKSSAGRWEDRNRTQGRARERDGERDREMTRRPAGVTATANERLDRPLSASTAPSGPRRNGRGYRR